MLYINAIKLLFLDMKTSAVRMGSYLLLLIAGLILYANNTRFMGSGTSIPDVFNVLFRNYSLIVIVIPVFLLLLSLVLPSIMEPLRIFRYRSRIKYGTVLLVVIGTFVFMFLLIYMLCGLLYGWWLSGTLENPWVTEMGRPFILFEGNVDFSLFGTGYMILRYVGTEFTAFMILGLLSVLIYVLIPRFIYVFFIVEGLVIFDSAISSLFRISIFLDKAIVSLENWGDVAYFTSILTYFLGVIVMLCVAIYVVVSKKDFLPVVEESS